MDSISWTILTSVGVATHTNHCLWFLCAIQAIGDCMGWKYSNFLDAKDFDHGHKKCRDGLIGMVPGYRARCTHPMVPKSYQILMAGHNKNHGISLNFNHIPGSDETLPVMAYLYGLF
jgi:hypothetical protein